MWIIVLIGILCFFGVIVGLIENIFNKSGDKDLLVTSIILMFGFLISIAWIGTSIVLTVKVSTSPELSRVEETQNIYSIRNEDGLSGKFALGFGTIDNEIYYVVLTKHQYGYRQEIIKGNNIYIIESDEETPRIDLIDYYKYDPLYSTLFNFSWVKRKHYVIYVPKDTLIIDWEID